MTTTRGYPTDTAHARTLLVRVAAVYENQN